MKGLIRNNFYTIQASLKASMAVTMVVLICVIISALRSPEYTNMINIALFASMGSFAGLSFTLIYNDSLSKWNRFELTTPINRKDVIKGRYITFGALATFALTMMILIYGVFNFITGGGNAERFGYALTFGVVFMLFIPAITHPLMLWLGMDKGQIIFMVSIGISLLFFIGTSVVLDDVLKGFEYPNLIYRVGVVSVSLLVFMSSYFISQKQYAKKDL